MATIRKRALFPSGRMIWELTHGSPPNRDRFIAGHTKEEATATLRLYRRQLERHGRAPEAVTMREAMKRYVYYLEVNRSPSTVRRYGRVVRTFMVCFMETAYPHLTALREIKPYHVDEYKERRTSGEIREPKAGDDAEREQKLRQHLAKHPKTSERKGNAHYGWLGRKRLARKVTKQTVNYELRTLRTFFLWAKKRNLLFMNPAQDVELFRVPKRALPKFFTKDELTAFFAACGEYERRVFSLLLGTGMRRGEIEHLEWSDVNVDLGVIMIHAKAAWSPKTNERAIPITDALAPVLAEQWAKRRSDRWVIANREGGRETHLLEKVKKICRRAKITPQAATVHALRHSFGAHLRMAGVPLATIADLMGHADLATTQIYAKVELTHLREQAGRMQAVLPKMTLENDTCGVEATTSACYLLQPKDLVE